MCVPRKALKCFEDRIFSIYPFFIGLLNLRFLFICTLQMITLFVCFSLQNSFGCQWPIGHFGWSQVPQVCWDCAAASCWWHRTIRAGAWSQWIQGCSSGMLVILPKKLWIVTPCDYSLLTTYFFPAGFWRHIRYWCQKHIMWIHRRYFAHPCVRRYVGACLQWLWQTHWQGASHFGWRLPWYWW